MVEHYTLLHTLHFSFNNTSGRWFHIYSCSATAFFWMAASYSLAWLFWHVQYLVPLWWMFSSFPINCSHTQTIFVLTWCAQCKDIHWINSERWSGRDRGYEHLQYWQFSYPRLRSPPTCAPTSRVRIPVAPPTLSVTQRTRRWKTESVWFCCAFLFSEFSIFSSVWIPLYFFLCKQ